MAEDERWNHNIHYHPVILDAVPAGARRALDVGCGEGMLARRLRRVVPEVVGIDPHAASIEQAESAGGDITYVVGDVHTHPFEPASFDLVVSVATLHHMDATAGLVRLRELLRPGGVLAVVGCARPGLRDLPVVAAGAVVNTGYRIRRTTWHHPSPIVRPPPETYTSMRWIAREVLPGSRLRRHLLWRYSLVWTRPGAATGSR